MLHTNAAPAPSSLRDGAGALPSDPRGVITGVTTSPSLLSEVARSAGEPSFDWYAATVVVTEDDLLGGLSDNLGAEVKEGRPLHGYSRGYELLTGEGVAARVLAGGANGSPHAWASGAAAESYAELVRTLWPDEHRVSRMDSRIDFGGVSNGEETWDALYEACVALAAEKGLRTSVAGDYLGKVAGRTLYVGSKKSDVFVRLYEKGKQLRGELRGAPEADRIPLDWCRLEVQVRPQGDKRWQAATASPAEAWGYSQWTQGLAAEVARLDVPRVSMQFHRETDDERALAWLARQYGGTFERLAHDRGWQSVVDRLADLVALAQGVQRGVLVGGGECVAEIVSGEALDATAG